MAQGIFTLRQVNQAIRQGAWTGPQKTTWVEYLVVAGGGGGGAAYGGGGGAGGLLTGILPVATGSSITATVGAAGTAALSAVGGTGGASVFGSITANGGGGGGWSNNGSATSGGSGGGGGGFGLITGASGISGQGSAGGNGVTSNKGGGGGGGAGTIGLNTIGGSRAGNGGAGIASAINGTVTAYAGGGGGGQDGEGTGAGTAAGAGGVGGGGAGGFATFPATQNGTAGTTNTGGGGGGSSQGGVPGTGGSGIVIVSYPDVYAAATSTTGSPTVSTSGSGSIYFDGSGDYMGITQQSLSTNDYTIECWLYATANNSNAVAYDGNNVDLAGNGAMFIWSTSAINFRFIGNGNPVVTFNGATINTWYHVAISKSGTGTNNVSCYVNGTRVGQMTYTTSLSSTVGTIGSYATRNNIYFPGYISNLRIVSGTALYSGATITVPTAPLTAVSGTTFLLSAVSGSAFADTSPSATTPTVVGNTAWNQLSPFATGLGYKNRVYTWTSSGSITF